ncbi:uncharacterized protein FOMMEDRAFT_147036 [Fomitiporia mediterranea MF3/22]|uniref:uncharacterized protein n=1 Tax=Fomitiporia mediterranea (strain MF3/22) TaxID=694068 RepID=UPI0004409672|nr:uncharacterized protein FOMMEDRAFT_147036 [Fomitiporia mediterranea MF3/22]EJD01832.1 hypothetical protein FOMMEDRAFT_147036 [Fomitiporia mediterranea MF3/22]
MSALSDYRASSGSLTSPSPSPPPVSPSKKSPSTAKAAGLDSSSELSELTEDEQDGSRESPHSDTPNQDGRRVQRRKRSGIVPEPMWDWAYKANGRKSNDTDEPSSTHSRNSAASNAGHAPDDIARDDIEKDDAEGSRPYTYPARRESDDDDDADDFDDGGDPDQPADSEPENDGVEPPSKPVPAIVPLAKAVTRESSTALTEDEEPTAAPYSDYSMESEEEEEPREEEDDVTGDAGEDGEEGEDVEDDSEPAKNVDTAPVVPLAPASSSIMAGQQIIKTPSPSPSTSPEPEDEPAEEPAGAITEKVVKAEPVEPETVTVAGPNDDGADNADQVEQNAERDADVEAEVETEEAELDLQPAHRAEALDVLAQIELRFALVREALYVEKMEDLAVEEALVLRGLHPEMIHLQNELQTRHDTRLELAAKKRSYEDEHVTLMRKMDEKSIWSWWKFERNDLQTNMFADSNRKRRRLEREKRALDRPSLPQRIPPPPAGRVPAKPLSVRELVKFASLDAVQDRPKLKRKRREPLDQNYAYPSLSVLSPQEIQTDLQLLTAPRSRAYHGPVMGEIGPGMNMPPSFDQHYIEYNAPPGMGPPGHGPAFMHGLPSGAMPVHHPYGPPPPGRVYHQPGPPPMSSIHHPGVRTMQGPGAPPTISAYPPHSTRQPLRSPSPPPMQGYEHGGPINGSQLYGATSGPGQHWTQVPPSATSNPNGAPGPSKQPMMNGYAKEHRRDREAKSERERERERVWHENNAKDAQAQDEYGRLHTPHLHRNNHMHQQLQGVPHHHHVVHRQNTHHHHHAPPGRTPLQPSGQRPLDVDHELSSRHPPPAVEQINLLQKPTPSSPYWKQEDERIREGERDRERDRDRSRNAHVPSGPPPMSQLGPPPSDRERPSFVMTPSQLIQAGHNPPRLEGGAPSRRDLWAEERLRYEQPDGFGHAPHNDGPSRRTHHVHSRQGSGSNVLGSPRMRNGNGLPPQSPPPSIPSQPSGPGMGPAPPPVFTPGLLHSPSRLSTSLHASPRASVGVSTPKGVGTRPVSPLPVSSKALPAAFTPAGPGTPGNTGSRLGTPGLAGPGTRPDAPLSGHGLGLTHGPGIYPPNGSTGLAGPAQPLIPPVSADAGHIAPPKMTPVQLGNGS